MIAKTMGILALLVLPVSASLWLTSHTEPNFRRYDVTLYKSLWVYLKDGVCGLELLSMPSKVASRSTFLSPLKFNMAPNRESLHFSTQRRGMFRTTWLVFPLWVSTSLLTVAGTIPLLAGPVRRWRRKRNGWCLFCGYDLTGNRTGRCPECGSHFRSHQTATRQQSNQRQIR